MISLTPGDGPISCSAWSPHYSQVFSVGTYGNIVMFDSRTGTKYAVLWLFMKIGQHPL